VKSSYHFLYLLLFVAQVLSYLVTWTGVVSANIRCGKDTFLPCKAERAGFFKKSGVDIQKTVITMKNGIGMVPDVEA
jgi:hypothetical protein